jgi:hypothetical protein
MKLPTGAELGKITPYAVFILRFGKHIKKTISLGNNPNKFFKQKVIPLKFT